MHTLTFWVRGIAWTNVPIASGDSKRHDRAILLDKIELGLGILIPGNSPN